MTSSHKKGTPKSANYAQDWIRTSTPFPALPPQGSASTNFATWASIEKSLMCCLIAHCSFSSEAAKLFYFFKTILKVVPFPNSEFFTAIVPL